MAINSNMRPAEMFQLRLLNQMGARRQRRSPTLFSSLADALRTAGTAYASSQITQGAQDRREAANKEVMELIMPRAPDYGVGETPEVGKLLNSGWRREALGRHSPMINAAREGTGAPPLDAGYRPGVAELVQAMGNEDASAAYTGFAANSLKTAMNPPKPQIFGDSTTGYFAMDRQGRASRVTEAAKPETSDIMTQEEVQNLMPGSPLGTQVKRIAKKGGGVDYKVMYTPPAPRSHLKVLNNKTGVISFMRPGDYDRSQIDTPELYSPAPKDGWTFVSDGKGGVTFTKGAGAGAVSKKVDNEIVDDMRSQADEVSGIKSALMKFDPQFHTLAGLAKAKGFQWKSWITGKLEPEQAKYLAKYTDYMATTGAVTAVKLNKLYGAALTPSEAGRAEKFTLAEYDDPITAYTKQLNGLWLAQKGFARNAYARKNGIDRNQLTIDQFMDKRWEELLREAPSEATIEDIDLKLEAEVQGMK